MDMDMDMNHETLRAETAGEARRDDVTTVSIDADRASVLVGTRNLVGGAVQNHKGEDLGEIKEIMFDAFSGQVGYAVLSFGCGVLGLGKKLFAVPWSALKFDSKQGVVVLQVEKELLKRSPGFDKNRWPIILDESSWWRGYHSYYH
ncbi:MAG: PRC-barrel domain-containing protein [Paralcaligenes sp.]